MTAAPDLAASFLKPIEGFSATPYPDSGGVWTIGYGTTYISGNPVTRYTQACTEELATAWLMSDMSDAWATVRNGVIATAKDCELAAFISFAYNEGDRAFLGSTLLARFNAGDIAGCEAQFSRWIYVSEGGRLVSVPGLVNRRAAEVALFRGVWKPPVAAPVVFAIGSKGHDVSLLQMALIGAGCLVPPPDGDFGEQTRAAVEKFQAANGLAVDGKVGPETAAVLGFDL
jgi:GH24 family phage-related lysozyme (muramidase)